MLEHDNNGVGGRVERNERHKQISDHTITVTDNGILILLVPRANVPKRVPIKPLPRYEYIDGKILRSSGMSRVDESVKTDPASTR